MRYKHLAVLTALLVCSALLWAGCSGDQFSTNPPAGDTTGLLRLLPDNAADVARVMAVQNRHTAVLEAVDGVVGTATGLDEKGNLAVLVLTRRPGVAGIPASLEGVSTRRIVTGEPMLFPKPSGKGKDKINLKKRVDRPVPIGVSIGNYNECAAGTYGCAVVKGGNRYILSNNHVLARQNAAEIGEIIGQPGLYDNKPRCSGQLADSIGRLSEFVEVVLGSSANNLVDAAIALSSPDFIDSATHSSFYGLPKSTPVEATVDMPIMKVGRNGKSDGVIIGINSTVTLIYAGVPTRFVDQILTSRRFSKSGDSGSLIVTDPDAYPVALLFAGTKDGYTWGNKINHVLSALNVSICGE